MSYNSSKHCPYWYYMKVTNLIFSQKRVLKRGIPDFLERFTSLYFETRIRVFIKIFSRVYLKISVWMHKTMTLLWKTVLILTIVFHTGPSSRARLSIIFKFISQHFLPLLAVSSCPAIVPYVHWTGQPDASFHLV